MDLTKILIKKESSDFLNKMNTCCQSYLLSSPFFSNIYTVKVVLSMALQSVTYRLLQLTFRSALLSRTPSEKLAEMMQHPAVVTADPLTLTPVSR